MTLSRSPSPVPGGGWSSPGLSLNNSSGTNTPAVVSGGPVQWESTAKMRHLGPNGYPSFSTHNQGFFSRHMRRISSSLPRFNNSNSDPRYADKEKLGRGQWPGHNSPWIGRIRTIFGRMGRKLKLRLLLGLIALVCVYIFYHSRESLTPTPLTDNSATDSS